MSAKISTPPQAERKGPPSIKKKRKEKQEEKKEEKKGITRSKGRRLEDTFAGRPGEPLKTTTTLIF